MEFFAALLFFVSKNFIIDRSAITASLHFDSAANIHSDLQALSHYYYLFIMKNPDT